LEGIGEGREDDWEEIYRVSVLDTNIQGEDQKKRVEKIMVGR